MQEAWRAYLELAMGLTETSRKKAEKVAKKLVGKSGATASQLQAMAEDLVSTSLANREALSKLVRFEVDRALGRVGLATAEEVADLTARVRDLEEQLREAKAPAAAPATAGAPAKSVAKKTVAKKSVAKKTVAKKAEAAEPATAEPASVEPAAAPAKKAEPAAPAKKAAARKAAPAKKTAAARKTAPAKKATAPETGEA
jgi:polyhydroxyalkanoate synthesis regulator phasin